MKSLYYLYAALVAALLLWSGCDPTVFDDDEMTPCTVDVPNLALSDACAPVGLTLTDLDQPQPGMVPKIMFTCPQPAPTRIVRVDPAADGDFILNLYANLPAVVYYQVFGADCEDNMMPLTECLETSAVATATQIAGTAPFDDVYVVLSYALFTAENHLRDYDLPDGAYIRLEAIDERPQLDLLPYRTKTDVLDGPESLAVSCDGERTQRIVLVTCNPDADLFAWAAEIGLPVSEQYQEGGVTLLALEVPESMDVNQIGGDRPVTKVRRPVVDSTDYLVEEDFLIELPSEANGGLIDLGNDGIQLTISGDPLACHLFDARGGSTADVAGNAVVTMIDSGVPTDGPTAGLYQNYRYRGAQPYRFLQPEGLGFDFITGECEPTDSLGHGTATTGTLVGSYRGERPLTVVHYKIFGAGNVATYFGALTAINAAVDAGSDIINMSWGIPQAEAPAGLECAVLRAGAAGVTVVTTAGNNALDIDAEPQWPGSFGLRSGFDHVVTVASYRHPEDDIDQAPELADFSNFSEDRTVVAGHFTFQFPRFGATDEQDYTFIAGTSISAPLVTASMVDYVGFSSFPVSDWLTERTETSDPLLFLVNDQRFLPICD